MENLKETIIRTLPREHADLAGLLATNEFQPLGRYALRLGRFNLAYLPFDGRSIVALGGDCDPEHGRSLHHAMNHQPSMLDRFGDQERWKLSEYLPTAALDALRKERGRWDWEWDDPERLPRVQASYLANHNHRYTPVKSANRGQIFTVKGEIGHGYAEGYAMVTGIMGGCARISGHLYLHANPEKRYQLQWFGEFRYDEIQLAKNIGPGKLYEPLEENHVALA